MELLAPKYSVEPHIDKREVHWRVEGLFDVAKSLELQKALFKAAQPLIEDGKGFRVMADMRDFPVQTRAIAEIIEQTQIGSAKLGVHKMVVIYSSVLVKQQWRRVSEVMDIEFFETEQDALQWLRT
uniref:STAS/SEC14 domain-containing protein n=1 Tax=uncultured Erythrobacter sp. TaxID=263913 RepID=UPI002633DAF8|nr:STAS/SEC14 domain-containing protein [uncultured Erythrobacter sp.]